MLQHRFDVLARLLPVSLLETACERGTRAYRRQGNPNRAPRNTRARAEISGRLLVLTAGHCHRRKLHVGACDLLLQAAGQCEL